MQSDLSYVHTHFSGEKNPDLYKIVTRDYHQQKFKNHCFGGFLNDFPLSILLYA